MFLELYEEKRSVNELPALLDIGTCGLHTIHGSLKNVEKASERDIVKVLKSWSKSIMDSPVRRKTLKKSKESLSLMFIYCHIVKIICVVRLKYSQHSIHFLTFNEAALSKATSRRRGRELFGGKKAVDDPLAQAKMKFLELLSFKPNEF